MIESHVVPWDVDQTIRFLTTRDGVRIAYATSGAGPPLVWAANWLSHLEFDAQSPVWRHWLEFLSVDHELVRYDQRGCGLSDWEVDNLSFDSWVADLEAVTDELGLERFAVVGISQGGPVAAEFSVRHPERVSHLILYGSYSLGRFMRGDDDAVRQSQALIDLMETGWGKENPAFRQVFTSMFIPGANDDQMHWFNDLARISTKPSIAARIMRSFSKINIRNRLAEVSVPTLVVHADRDAMVPLEQGRLLAAEIPGARFVLLRGQNHILLENEPAWREFQKAFCDFLGIPATTSTSGETPVAHAPGSSGPRYKVGEVTIDVSRREVHNNGVPVPVERKAFDLIVYLIENRDRVVDKEELQDALWRGAIVTDSALTRCVMKARRSMSDDSEKQSVIKTVHGHGYRFVGPVNH